jgi:hypothetical protein
MPIVVAMLESLPDQGSAIDDRIGIVLAARRSTIAAATTWTMIHGRSSREGAMESALDGGSEGAVTRRLELLQ